MNTYNPQCGESIGETAKCMVVMAIGAQQPVQAKFNDILLTANPGDTPDSITAFYRDELNRRHEAYINSPEYAAQQREAEEAQRRKDIEFDEAMKAAPEKMTLRDEAGWVQVVEKTETVMAAALFATLSSGRESWKGGSLAAKRFSHAQRQHPTPQTMKGSPASCMAALSPSFLRFGCTERICAAGITNQPRSATRVTGRMRAVAFSTLRSSASVVANMVVFSAAPGFTNEKVRELTSIVDKHMANAMDECALAFHGLDPAAFTDMVMVMAATHLAMDIGKPATLMRIVNMTLMLQAFDVDAAQAAGATKN